MSAREWVPRGSVSGPTHRSAPTESIEIPINPRRAGGDRAPPLSVDRGAKRRADVVIGPYEKEGKLPRPPWPAAHSGASSSAVTRGGIGVRQRSSPKCPATSDNPSVALRATAPVAVSKILCSLIAHRILTAATRSPRCICPRQRSVRSPFAQGSLWPCGGRGKGRTLPGHRSSQQPQAGRDGARPLHEHRECRSVG